MIDMLSAKNSPQRCSYGGEDIETGKRSAEIQLDPFFKKIQHIENEFEKLNKLLKNLQVSPQSSLSYSQPQQHSLHITNLCRNAHEESKSVTKAASMKEIKQRMEKDVDEVGMIARFIKAKLQELDKENLANRQNLGCGQGTAVDRTRTATTLHLKKKFKDKVTEFQTLRESIHQEHRQVVERRVFTVTGTIANEETIDRLIETGDSEKIFQKAIQEQGRGQVVDTLAEIQEHHDAVIEMEHKLLELQQIFQDMAILVDAQGGLLDTIETHVSSAVDHVQSGNKAIQKAKKLQKNSRKWMCWVIIVLLVIISIVLVAVLKPWQSVKGA